MKESHKKRKLIKRNGMNKWKAFAILFTLFSIGALKETLRIFTSDAPDIMSNRTELIIISVLITSLIVFLTIRFWKKASDN
jgi:hypothetical protein